jgi:hypothetical protein
MERCSALGPIPGQGAHKRIALSDGQWPTLTTIRLRPVECIGCLRERQRPKGVEPLGGFGLREGRT